MENKVTVRMKADHAGSEDGVRITQYAGGQVYEIAERLASVFLQYDMAEAVNEKPEPEKTHQDPPPEGGEGGEQKPEPKGKGKR